MDRLGIGGTGTGTRRLLNQDGSRGSTSRRGSMCRVTRRGGGSVSRLGVGGTGTSISLLLLRNRDGSRASRWRNGERINRGRSTGACVLGGTCAGTGAGRCLGRRRHFCRRCATTSVMLLEILPDLVFALVRRNHGEVVQAQTLSPSALYRYASLQLRRHEDPRSAPEEQTGQY